MDPWAFRSVLDKEPRMLTVALDSTFFVAYDLANSKLYKAWKGGVELEGTAFTNKKNVQPTTWGQVYYSDSIQNLEWIAESQKQNELPEVVNSGYLFRNNQIYLKHSLILSSGDTISVEERPEFVQDENDRPGLERMFKASNVPDGFNVSLKSNDTIFRLNSNSETLWTLYFDPLPQQVPPDPKDRYDHLGKYWMEKSGCVTCHEYRDKNVGPSFYQIAEKYRDNKEVIQELVRKVKEGGAGVWGTVMMNPHPDLSDREIRTVLDYILSLKPDEEEVAQKEGKPKEEEKAPKENEPAEVVEKKPEPKENLIKPGFGAPLEAVHPSYNLTNIHNENFKPRVGGLAFLPDGRLLVTTWDAVGGVYIIDGFQTGDPEATTVKRIASGLAEPLGLEVVDGEIYVLQKHELTHLVDLDGDEVIDYYRPVSNKWGVTDDFHEFAFGLVHKDDHFYLTLSLAMRLMSGERQKPDRGKTLKVSMDGQYEELNYGLRTPNGIGLGVDDELFVTDNQGQWLPANKFIHVKKGDFHGMRWVLPDSLEVPPPTAPATILLPSDEIGNSPSEPILINDGPYKGQMLHGDVSHGGIKRDFLEKVNGDYQGAVFRFSQGLEAGVNRLVWGPDGALYVGGVGMVGGWSWKGRQYGLQRMEYNGKTTFEMLAVRAKNKGFEIEFTEPLDSPQDLENSDFFVQQWWYLPTANYGGPKMDLEKMKVEKMEISEDGKRVYLEIPGLKKEHLVYFKLAEDLQSKSGQSLWSSEAWYTLNNIPDE